MTALFFSDVHGALDCVKLLARHVEALRPDTLVLLGDVLYHGPRNPLRGDYAPPEVVPLLNAWSDKIVAVRGNCDSEVDQCLLDFPLMAAYSTLLLGEHRFFLTHGHAWTAEAPPPLPPGTVFASGHTHIPRLEKLENELWAFNPGSISLPKGGSAASFGFYRDGVLRVCALGDGKTILEARLG